MARRTPVQYGGEDLCVGIHAHGGHMTEEISPAEQIKETLRRIAELDIERDLVRLQELGQQVNFAEHRDLFTEVLGFTATCSDLPWETLTTQQQSQVLSLSQALHANIEGIREFSVASSGNPASDKNSRAAAVHSGIENFKTTVIPFVGYLSWNSIDLNSYRDRLEESVSETQQRAQQQIQGIEKFREQAERALQAIREAAAEQGVSQETTTFREAANRYVASAQRWLWAAIAMGLTTVGAGFAIVLLWGLDGQISDAEVLQIVLAKAAVLAVLVYATVTAVKMYRSNAHLAAVNRHREDALRTFRSFVEGTETDETKDQVLLAAARAAFGQVPTGLVTDKSDSASLLEVLGGIGSNLTRRS